MTRTIALRIASVLLPVSLLVFGQPAASRAAGPLTMTAFSPHSGAVGKAVTITGTGFVAADVVRFNGTPAVVSKVNKAGKKLTTSVPPLATSGPISVQDPATGQIVSLPGTTFVVSKGLFPSPRHGWAGGTIDLAGSGLTPDQVLPVMLGSTMVAEAQVNGTGGFQVPVAVPWTQPSGKTSLSIVDPTLHKIHTIFYVLGNWPTFQHDSAHSGRDDYETALTTSNVSKLKPAWSFDLTVGDLNVLPGAPTIADDVVYIGSADTFYALNATTGAELWSKPIAIGHDGAAAVADGMVFVGASDGLYALDATTGTTRWFIGLSSASASPTVVNGVVYLVSGSDTYALNETTGVPIWSVDTGGGYPVAVVDNVVYVPSASIWALNATTGGVIWTHALPTGLGNAIAVGGSVVYVDNSQYNLYALNASDGTVRWSKSLDSSPCACNRQDTPVLIGGDVIVGAHYYLHAYDASTGAQQWQYALKTEGVSGSGAGANGVFYIGDDNGVMRAFNASIGISLWSWQIPTNAVFEESAAVSDGFVYDAYQGGTLVAFHT